MKCAYCGAPAVAVSLGYPCCQYCLTLDTLDPLADADALRSRLAELSAYPNLKENLATARDTYAKVNTFFRV